MATVFMTALLGGFFVAAATMDRHGGAMVGPATAPMMPNQGLLFGLPPNLVVFGVALAFVISGYLIAHDAKPIR